MSQRTGDLGRFPWPPVKIAPNPPPSPPSTGPGFGPFPVGQPAPAPPLVKPPQPNIGPMGPPVDDQ